jgi:hypothetical protein
MLDRGREEAESGEIPVGTRVTLCRIQIDALKDLKQRLAGSATKENVAVAESELAVLAETARILASDDALHPETNPALVRGDVQALAAFVSSAEARAKPEKLRAAYRRMIAKAEKLQDSADGLQEGNAAQQANAAEFAALAQQLRGAARQALVALTLEANPTWALDHPRAQPTPAMIASMEKGLDSKTSFAKLRAQADEAYRTSPGVAEKHVERIVNRLIGSKPSELRKKAMRVAVGAWLDHRTGGQIRNAVADLRARPLVHDLFYGRVEGAERGYERTLSIVRAKIIAGRSTAEIRKAVFAEWNAHAPKRDYKRVVIRGGLTNRYTAEMLMRAEAYSKSMRGPDKFWITQGSYSTSVSASAGTHDGGGALDISVNGMSRAEMHRAVKALRTAGFAAWLRGPPSFDPHIHAIAIGDGDASPAAKDQVTDYRHGRDGLAYHGPDPDLGYAGRPIPKWGR